MAVVGVGTDLCRVSRIVRTLDRFGDRFLERAFHPTEAAFLRRLRDERSPHLGSALASRWAAKEATYKALAGWRVPFPDMEVAKDARGAPRMQLHGETASRAAALGVRIVHLSISHEDDLALAFVVLSGER